MTQQTGDRTMQTDQRSLIPDEAAATVGTIVAIASGAVTARD